MLGDEADNQYVSISKSSTMQDVIETYAKEEGSKATFLYDLEKKIIVQCLLGDKKKANIN